ncbi:MAG: hypothetical protein ABIA47_01910 [bacterium]
MRTSNKLLLGALSLILMGQGCLGFGGESTSSNGGMFRTDDSGVTWTQLSALPSASGVGSIAGVNVTSIEVDPNDNSAIYIGTVSNGMFFSLDSGTTWQRPEDSEASDGTVLDVEVDEENICTIYVLKPSRILKSNSCSRGFSSIYVETRSDEELTSFAVDWFDTNILWAGTSAGDVLKSTDAGANWTTVGRVGDDVMAIMVSNADSRIVLVGTEAKGLFRTTDGGENWTEFEDDLRKEFRNSDDVFGFTQTASGGTVAMNTKYGLLVSTDKGASWKAVPLVTSPGEVRVWGVALDPKDGNTIYYGTSEIFYTSTSGGSSWATQELPSSRAPKAMLVHPLYTDNIFVGFASVDD